MINNMQEKPYEYINGALSAIRHPILTSGQLSRLDSAANKNDFLSVLREYNYGTGDYSDCFAAIDSEFDFVVKFLKENAPSNELLKMFLFEDDIHNLKCAVKSVIYCKDCSEIFSEHSYYAWENIYNCAKNKDFSIISTEFSESVSDIWETDNPAEISSIIDNSYFSDILRTAEKSNVPFFKKYLNEYAICKNFVTSARINKLGGCETNNYLHFLPAYGTFSDAAEIDISSLPLSEIEARTDSHINEFFAANDNPFGIVPLARYFFGKKAELKKLRFMLANKQH